MLFNPSNKEKEEPITTTFTSNTMNKRKEYYSIDNIKIMKIFW
jgi:hypothetical protein